MEEDTYEKLKGVAVYD